MHQPSNVILFPLERFRARPPAYDLPNGIELHYRDEEWVNRLLPIARIAAKLCRMDRAELEKSARILASCEVEDGAERLLAGVIRLGLELEDMARTFAVARDRWADAIESVAGDDLRPAS